MTQPEAQQQTTRPVPKRWPILLATAIAATVMVGVADFLEDRLESREDAASPNRVTVIEVDYESHGHRPGASDAEQLWLLCSEGLSDAQRAARSQWLGPGRMVVDVNPALGERKRWRVRGCLSDLSVEWVRTTAVRMREEPADPA